jgi:hypothetical protein
VDKLEVVSNATAQLVPLNVFNVAPLYLIDVFEYVLGMQCSCKKTFAD